MEDDRIPQPVGEKVQRATPWLGGLQALRGVAALAVVVHHALEIANGPAWLTRVGAAGVDVFFVISGFVMLYSSRGLTGGAFLLRRLARIVPLYWLTTLGFVALAASGAAFQSLDVNPRRVIGSLLFFSPDPVLSVGWTLNYEMYFYLLFAAVIAVGLFRAAALVIPAVLLAAVIFAGPKLGSPIVLEFGFGVILAAALRRGLSGRWAVPAAVGAALLFVGTSLFWSDAPTNGLGLEVRWLAWGAPAALAVYAAIWWKPRFSLLGDASYSIYLTHGLVMAALGKLLASGRAPLWPTVAGSVVVSVALGIAVYLAVERPLHRWTSAHLRTRKARLTVQPTAPPLAPISGGSEE